MSRSRHVDLEQRETAVHGGRARRRAALEEQISGALAEGDRQSVSELNEELERLEDRLCADGWWCGPWMGGA